MLDHQLYMLTIIKFFLGGGLPFVFLGPHLCHMEVSRLGVKLEPQLSAYATDTATPDPSCVCDLHHNSQQHQILDPLSEARDRTCILMDTRPLSHDGNSWINNSKLTFVFKKCFREFAPVFSFACFP